MNDAIRCAKAAWDETNACTCPEKHPCAKCYGVLLAALDEILGMPAMVTVSELKSAVSYGDLITAANADRRQLRTE